MIKMLLKILQASILTLLSVLYSKAQALPPEPALKFYLGTQLVNEITLGQLQKTLAAKEVTIKLQSKFYPKVKNFKGMPLTSVINLGFKKVEKKRQNFQASAAVLEAIDGYRSYSSVEMLAEPGAILVYQDLDRFPDWELIGPNAEDPAPFFLVWQGQTQTTAQGYPWPWQLQAIHLVKFAEHFPRLAPKTLPSKGPVARGFKLFQKHCFRCHSLHQEGGSIGPDLASNDNMLAKKSRQNIKKFIRHPAKSRELAPGEHKMPDHEFLSSQELDNLLDYLFFIRNTKAKVSSASAGQHRAESKALPPSRQ